MTLPCMCIRFAVLIASLPALCLGSALASSRHLLSVPTPDGPVAVECFADTALIERPTVLILSGSKGFGSPAYEEIGQTLLGAGLQPCLVHFLSPADVNAIDEAGNTSARERYYAQRQSAWIAAVKAVVAYFNTRSGHTHRIGLLGISLGAEMALASSANSKDIGALVIVDGGFPDGYSQAVHTLPPLQLIWGREDRTFPLSVGLDLQHMAQHIGAAASLDVYEGGTHAFFLQPRSPMAQAAHMSAARFLIGQLGDSNAQLTLK
jgi:dienelactone hydrolase